MHTRLWFTALLLFFSVFPALAAQFCVRSAAELSTALTTAQDNQQDDEIRLRSGTYLLPTGTVFTALVTDNRGLTISGGWGGATETCTGQSSNALNTILQRSAGTPGRVMFLRGGSAVTTEISIRNLSMKYGEAPINGTGGCLDMQSQGQMLRLERVLLQDCLAPLGDGGGAYLSGLQIKVLGNLVQNSEAKRGGGLYVRVGSGSGDAYINNNTVTANMAVGQSGQGGGLQVFVDGGAQASLANNIAWNNSTGTDRYDVKVEGSGSTSSGNDHIDELGGTFTTGAVNRTTGSPGFVAVQDFRLTAASPCRDSGQAAAAGGVTPLDLVGALRPQGARVDRGAFEFVVSEAIFRGDFE